MSSQVRDYLREVERNLESIMAKQEEIAQLRAQIDELQQEAEANLRVAHAVATRMADTHLGGQPGGLYYNNWAVVAVTSDMLVSAQMGCPSVYLVPCRYVYSDGQEAKDIEAWTMELTGMSEEPEQLTLDSFIESVDLPQEEEVSEDDIALLTANEGAELADAEVGN